MRRVLRITGLTAARHPPIPSPRAPPFAAKVAQVIAEEKAEQRLAGRQEGWRTSVAFVVQAKQRAAKAPSRHVTFVSRFAAPAFVRNLEGRTDTGLAASGRLLRDLLASV